VQQRISNHADAPLNQLAIKEAVGNPRPAWPGKGTASLGRIRVGIQQQHRPPRVTRQVATQRAGNSGGASTRMDRDQMNYQAMPIHRLNPVKHGRKARHFLAQIKISIVSKGW
jgi:hypothetical protein